MSPYPPLPHMGDYIRLLELAPGHATDELAGKFLVHNLENVQPEYLATSYVCGDDNRAHHHVLMSGSKLGIYKNADEVLRRFRSKTDTVYLWIDVVCIDQDDPTEKAREVNLMHKVYQNSKQTMIWLGHADAGALTAIKYANTLDATKYLEEYQPIVLRTSSQYTVFENKSHILEILKDHPQKESLINCCAELLLRPWFSRMWTAQEAALSSEPILVCGMETMPWSSAFALSWLFLPRHTMMWPTWFLPNNPHGYANLEPHLHFTVIVQECRFRQESKTEAKAKLIADMGIILRKLPPLWKILESTRRLSCSDPRDKIYAVRNMADDVTDMVPYPDYVTPWEDVYTDVSRNIVKMRLATGNSPELLPWSGLCQQGKDSPLPSWAVDWRFPYLPQYIVHEQWCAGGKDFRPIVAMIPKRKRRHLLELLEAANQPRKPFRYTLQVTVVVQDTIAYLSGILEDWKFWKDVESLHQDLLDLDSKSQDFINSLPHSTYITSESVLNAYNATLVASTSDQDTMADPSYIANGAVEWRAWLSSGASLQENTMPKYHDAIDNADTFSRKQFCASKAGYFCLVPSITEPTDQIAVVKGQDIPIVLRPFDDYYIYIGQCYIHGMMERQAGTLAEEFSVRYDHQRREAVIKRPNGDIRRNGLKMDAGEYVRILKTLGGRPVELV